MPDTLAALPLPQRRRKGPPPFVPTSEQRRVIAALAGFGISQPAMCELLRREGAHCVNAQTLRKAFRDELKHGKELMIAALGVRMYDIAMSDRPQAFNALAFLLRTHGGAAWRAADPHRDEEMPPAPEGNADNVHFYMPPNHRDEPEAGEEDGPVIEGEAA
jgi:hypothetical protein